MSNYHAYFFPNGNIAVTEGQKQIPELQRESVPSMFAKFVESKGYDPLCFTLHLPQGEARLFKTEDGWDWNFTH